MPESKDRTVHVDATMDLKDYFYAYFDINKTKLIIACLIVATVIAAFTYFFILIGEQNILWQLSPLFFGLPIVAIVGQFLRFHASYRKYLRDLSDSEKDIHYIFKENGDGFSIVRGKNFGHVVWESVRKVTERPRYFQFVLNKYESIIIPKRFFSHRSDEALIKQIIISQVGNKAKLLSHLLLSLALVIAIVLCDGPAYAQDKTPENAQPPNAALREKAFKLLESVAGQLTTLQSGENRARLGSNIAASLWNHDEKRARALFAAVEEDIRAGLQYRTSDDPWDEHTLMVFLRLRMDTIERIAKHDAKFAFAFFKATEMDSDKSRPRSVVETERELEIRLARQIAADNPDLALKVGRKSLARGLSHDFLPVLRELHRKHREQGVILYKEVIVKLREVNLDQDWNTMYFARVLADSIQPPLADESAFRDLINLFITTALANGCDKPPTDDGDAHFFCTQLTPLFQRIEKIDPLRAAQLKRWAPEGDVTAESLSAHHELSDLTQTGTVDDILSLAERYPDFTGEIHMQAMMKAQASGDLERARKIATNYDGDPAYRQRMLAQMERAELWVSKKDEQLAEVLRKISTIPSIKERARRLLILAVRIGENDRKTALMLSNQASAMIDTMRPDKEQTDAQLALALTYCLEKNDRGLSLMESLMPKLNELVAAAAKLDGYDNRYLRDGEWNMSGEGGLGGLLKGLADYAGYFAWCDFDRAVSVADQFERPEIRLMAHVKLAQGILSGPPKRPVFGDGIVH